MKKIREGRVIHTGWYTHHVYEDRDGVTTLTGLKHLVQIIVEIQDGPDAGRKIQVRMTREQAMAHIRALSDAGREIQVRMTRELADGGPADHEHAFWDTHSEAVCVGSATCTLTYGEYREQQS
jgi:hypothetical protein